MKSAFITGQNLFKTGEIKYLKAYKFICIDREYILEIREISKEDRTEVEFWLQGEKYGISQFLIGIPKENYTEEFERNYIVNSLALNIGYYRKEFEA